MSNTISTDHGTVEISREVIASIAGAAAMECYGLVGMASQRLQDGLAELLGKEANRKGVEVTVQESAVIVDVYIIVGYGTRISEVARNVMEKVKYSVEAITGIEVSRVNVIVQGVKVVD